MYVPENSVVLEIGTATGEVLASLKPKLGVGIDISPKMIEKAVAKYKDSKNLSFKAVDVGNLESGADFDYVVLTDVIEHAPDAEQLIIDMKIKSKPHTRIFMSMVNPVWEPFLMLIEKLKLKMPEGEHFRIPSTKLLDIFHNNGFVVEKHGYFLPLPKYIPVVSDIINYLIPRLPLLNRVGLIEYFVFTRK